MVNMCSHIIKPESQIEKPEQDSIFPERERGKGKKERRNSLLEGGGSTQETYNKMALYVDEEEIWKCLKHPSKRRRTGICHVCLRERLSSLCPDCASARPCTCYATTASSSSGTTSSSSSHCFSSASGIGSVGRVSNLIESEPAFRRSRSLAVPFLRSKPSADHSYNNHKASSSFWSLFKGGHGNRSMREEVERRHVVILKEEELEESSRKVNEDEERRRMMRKSRSVAVTSESRGSDVRRSSKGGKGWYFPSPIKVFKQSISRGILAHERSPLYRG